MEGQIETKYPPSFWKLQSEVTLLLRHKPPTQPAFMTNIPHKRMKSIKPICHALPDYNAQALVIKGISFSLSGIKKKKKEKKNRMGRETRLTMVSRDNKTLRPMILL